jgi:NADPH:quinone reductase-like Zn-dependent oxidoreductase
MGQALERQGDRQVGTAEKAAVARVHGCDYPLLYSEGDWVAQIRELTAGQGLAVVYDSIGRNTFMHGIDTATPLINAWKDLLRHVQQTMPSACLQEPRHWC